MRRGLFVVVVLASANCTVLVRESPNPQCRVNADCLDVGADRPVCFAERCMNAERAPADEVFVQVSPPSSLALSRQQLTMSVDKGEAEIRFGDTRRWSGSISSPGLGSVRGHFVLEREPLIPGQSLFFEFEVGVGDDRFAVALAPGQYRVVFIPARSDLPQMAVGTWTVGEQDITLPTLLYPAEQSFTRVRGRVAPSALNPLLNISGARVFASRSNDQSGSPLTSTMAITGEDGTFDIAFATQVSTIDLHIEPSLTNPYIPQVRQTLLDISQGADLGTRFIGEIGSPVAVLGSAKAGPVGNEVVVSNARIFARAALGSGTTVQFTNSKPPSGGFEIDLLRQSGSTPIDYTFTIVPPEGGTYGLSEIAYSLSATGEPDSLAVRLAERPVVSGEVSDAAGTVVTAASIIARPVGKLASYVGSTQTLTGSDGRFVLRLDRGTYDLRVEPQGGAALPWYQQRVEISSANTELSIQLAPVALVAGQFVAPRGTDFRGATLDFFRVSTNEQGVRQATPVGRSTVDEVGHYSVALQAE